MNCNGSDLAELIKKEFVQKGLDRIRKDGIEKNWKYCDLKIQNRKGLYQKGPDWEGLNGKKNMLDSKYLDFKKLDWKG